PDWILLERPILWPTDPSWLGHLVRQLAANNTITESDRSCRDTPQRTRDLRPRGRGVDAGGVHRIRVWKLQRRRQEHSCARENRVVYDAGFDVTLRHRIAGWTGVWIGVCAVSSKCTESRSALVH